MRDEFLIGLFERRDGFETLVDLAAGRHLTVRNIAWGYDDGDEYAHVTTNISPTCDDVPVDIFFTNEVVAVRDSESGTILFPAE